MGLSCISRAPTLRRILPLLSTFSTLPISTTLHLYSDPHPNHPAMVLVEEVPEDILLQEGEKESDFETDSNASDASSIFSDDEEDLLADESLYDRLVALKDIVPPTTRNKAHARYVSAKTWTWWSLQSAGSVAWWVSTSALLIGLPLALAIDDEHKVVQQEREMQMQNYGQQQVRREDEFALTLQLTGGQAQPQGVTPPGF